MTLIRKKKTYPTECYYRLEFCLPLLPFWAFAFAVFWALVPVSGPADVLLSVGPLAYG